MECCNQNFFFFPTLLKIYFDLNMKCLFCGEFCWGMMIIGIKIIITLLFIYSFFILFHLFILNAVWYLRAGNKTYSFGWLGLLNTPSASLQKSKTHHNKCPERR